MADLKIYIPKSLEFQRLAKLASSASRQIDTGTPPNDAHIFAFLEYIEFLSPQQFSLVMGPGLAAEFSAITEHEFPFDSVQQEMSFGRLLQDHTSMFAGAFCRVGDEQPRCYRNWKRVREEYFSPGSFSAFACLSANIAMAFTLSPTLPADTKLHLLRYRILKRTAEVLQAFGYDPTEQLRQIPEQGPNPEQLLAMQVLALSKGTPDDLMRLCGKINGSSEATLLHWASHDSFVSYLLEACQWLQLVRYNDASALNTQPTLERSGLLYTRWMNGTGAPGGLARRDLNTLSGVEQHVSRAPAQGWERRFASIPIMLIGASRVGKTAFLSSLTRHLNLARGKVRDGLRLEVAGHLDPNRLPAPRRKTVSEELNRDGDAVDDQVRGLEIVLREDRDPRPERWMRLSLTESEGSDVSESEFSPDFLKELRSAKGLLFFADDGYFRDLSPNSDARRVRQTRTEDAVDLSARYTRILQAYFDVNRDALHLPIGLILNKADVLLGQDHVLTMDAPVLIAPDTKMELVHAGLDYQGEPVDPFGRLQHCIRHTLSNSKDLKHQSFCFEMLEHFRGFISAALSQSYRFQIFLTVSVVPEGANREYFPFGVWEPVKWMVNQLEPAFRSQAREQLERDQADLKQLKQDIDDALLRDREAYADFQDVCKRKERRVGAKLHLGAFDYVLGRDPTTTGKRMESAREMMHAALEEALRLMGLNPPAEATDPLPFTVRRQMAQKAQERLAERIAELSDWHERLTSKTQPIPLARHERKISSLNIKSTSQEQKAS
jgi:hypothetical protein